MLGAFAVGGTSAALADTASCSATYHAALDELRKSKGEDLTNAVAALRAADPMLPGQWIFSRALFFKAGRAARPVEQERACVERIKVAGRYRCSKFAETAAASEPILPTELTITPVPSSDEQRILKAVADLVDGRGAVPDVGNNGRHAWLSQRASSDLRLYVSQPAHPALCSGGREISEFYVTALKPLQKRADDVAELVKRTRNLAATRIIAAATPATASGSATSAIPTSAQPNDAAPAVVQASTAVVATAADLANLPLASMTAEAVRAVLSPADVSTILQEKSGLAALQRAKPGLILAQVDATRADDAKRELVLAAGRAVRMIEAAAYTEIYAERYRKFNASVLSLPREIQQLHAKICTCAN